MAAKYIVCSGSEKKKIAGNDLIGKTGEFYSSTSM